MVATEKQPTCAKCGAVERSPAHAPSGYLNGGHEFRMEAHTKGPWRVVVDEVGRVSIVADYHIAHVLYTGHPADVMPNARLMASSPDLLSACRGLLHLLKAMPEAEVVQNAPVWTRIVGDAEAAIAKAEGRA